MFWYILCRQWVSNTAKPDTFLSCMQLTLQQVGTIPGPVLPQNVTGELDLTQGFGPLDNGTAANPWLRASSQPQHASVLQRQPGL